MNVAFCINRLGLVGLGVTVSSLIRNCSNAERLQLWFFCADLNDSEKHHIRQHLISERFSGVSTIVDFDPKLVFGSFRSLHGDWTPYGRLLLADTIKDDKVLYLDSDLVVEVDVLELESFDFKGLSMAAVFSCLLKYNLEHEFYTLKLGLPPDMDTFNSGVLLLNLIVWRQENVKEACLRIARQYPMELPSHDQSILNIYVAGNFAKLPASYNCEWPADKDKPKVADNMILHFVGSPKPWDPFGKLIHKGYSAWAKYNNKDWAHFTNSFKLDDLRRLWNIRRSYIRSVLNKIKG